MIVIFGPAGAGKTAQGQLLAKKHGWKWLSVGQILRDTHDETIINTMSEGKLASTEFVDNVISKALIESGASNKVIIDGFPRELDQAKWLIKFCEKNNRTLNLAIVLDVPEAETMRRLLQRGRIDDLPDSIKERLKIYHNQINPILDYFNSQYISVAHINGVGSIKDINTRINKKLSEEKII